jgi:hypothetical protein
VRISINSFTSGHWVEVVLWFIYLITRLMLVKPSGRIMQLHTRHHTDAQTNLIRWYLASCLGRVFFFFFSILWCSWSDNHPLNDLSRFGYILVMKVEKNQNPSIFLATYWNLS